MSVLSRMLAIYGQGYLEQFPKPTNFYFFKSHCSQKEARQLKNLVIYNPLDEIVKEEHEALAVVVDIYQQRGKGYLTYRLADYVQRYSSLMFKAVVELLFGKPLEEMGWQETLHVVSWMVEEGYHKSHPTVEKAAKAVAGVEVSHQKLKLKDSSYKL